MVPRELNGLRKLPEVGGGLNRPPKWRLLVTVAARRNWGHAWGRQPLLHMFIISQVHKRRRQANGAQRTAGPRAKVGHLLGLLGFIGSKTVQPFR
jgi:hypothetical protein